MLQAGTLGLLGLSTTDVAAWRARAAEVGIATKKPRAVIYLFLTGGLSQHDSFDMKPDGPVDFKGEFNPIATQTPGIQICEHMPLLAQRSERWSLVRSLTHNNNGHDAATYMMLTGKSELPPTYRSMKPQSIDLPCLAAIAGSATRPRNHLPPSVVLPEKLYHSNSGTFSGQFAGMLGHKHEPWFIEATDKPHAYHSYSGAFPKYLFNLHKGEPADKLDWRFEVPNLTLPEGVLAPRFRERREILNIVEQQQRHLEDQASVGGYDRIRQSVISLMADPKVREAFDVRKADPKLLERYGDNSFGWSLLMAKRLIEAGVNMIQVNMGNFGSWDLHGNNFPMLKNFLFPPTDLAVSALLDDLQESGMLDDTLVVMAGEFGRTPRISHVAPEIYKTSGRDHWGAVQTAWFAGGGVRGGQVLGASDASGAYPSSDPQKPENFAATIYHALGIPVEAAWHDATGRPYPIYEAQPIERLFA
ncbi:MAG: DUF1501 domain-containing protein [Planctomycetaceae bacterium]|nr:DUF1501 domain-containing protein [Planctomycetaceae bacterium]